MSPSSTILHQISLFPLSKAIPTPPEIRSAAVCVLQERELSGIKVVKMESGLVVKYGSGVSLHEGETMQYLKRHSRVPVPRVLAMFSDTKPPGHRGEQIEEHFLVMEFVAGQTLEYLLRPDQQPCLTSDELLEIGRHIKAAITEMRGLKSSEEATYFGGVNRRRLEDGVFWTESLDPAICGPFDTEEALNEAMIRRIRELVDEPQTNLIRSLIAEVLCGRQSQRPVFTHGDLQPKNIMVERLEEDLASYADALTMSAKPTPTIGRQRFRVTLIDFELSGWYPDWWEFATAAYMARFKPTWHALLQDAHILQPYPIHFAMLSLIRGIIFW